MSLRRLRVLIENLPTDAMTYAAMANLSQEQRFWTITDHLLATVADLIQVSNWQFASANSKSAPRRPTPIYRPGQTVASGRTTERVTSWPGRTVYTKE